MPTTHTQAWSARRVEPVKGVEEDHLDPVKLDTGTYLAGTLIGEVTATPGLYKAYDKDNVDGTQNPTHILEYDVVVASGNHFLGDAAASEWGQSMKYTHAWRGGVFDIADLVGYDAEASVNGKFRPLGNGRVLVPSA